MCKLICRSDSNSRRSKHTPNFSSKNLQHSKQENSNQEVRLTYIFHHWSDSHWTFRPPLNCHNEYADSKILMAQVSLDAGVMGEEIVRGYKVIWDGSESEFNDVWFPIYLFSLAPTAVNVSFTNHFLTPYFNVMRSRRASTVHPVDSTSIFTLCYEAYLPKFFWGKKCEPIGFAKIMLDDIYPSFLS